MAYASIVVMGVSGSGKSTVGALLAARIALPFVDGDDLHTPANKQKMAAGIPLDDADRAPWLDAIAAALARAPVLIACRGERSDHRHRIIAGGHRRLRRALAGASAQSELKNVRQHAIHAKDQIVDGMQHKRCAQ